MVVEVTHSVLYARRLQDMFCSLCLSQGCCQGPGYTEMNVLQMLLWLQTLDECRERKFFLLAVIEVRVALPGIQAKISRICAQTLLLASAMAD